MSDEMHAVNVMAIAIGVSQREIQPYNEFQLKKLQFVKLLVIPINVAFDADWFNLLLFAQL